MFIASRGVSGMLHKCFMCVSVVFLVYNRRLQECLKCVLPVCQPSWPEGGQPWPGPGTEAPQETSAGPSSPGSECS